MRYNVSFELPSGERGFKTIVIDTKNEDAIKANIEKSVGSKIRIRYIKQANSAEDLK